MITRKRAFRGALTLTVALGFAAAALPAGAVERTPTVERTPAAEAAYARATASAPSNAAAASDARLRALLHRLTTVDGAPGAFVETRDRRGSAVLTDGVADIERRTPLDPDSRFRIGSMTKTFTATALLLLVEEKSVHLDAPVERYLPGVVRGHGNDGRRITVRQLLQHTSGLPDFLDHFDPRDIVMDPLAHRDPLDLVNIALAHPPEFAPGAGWSYSNTGYLLVGMIIERVTGNTYGEEIERRVIEPLGLSETSVPGDDPTIPGPHPRGYVRPGDDAPLLDITAVNPSVGGAAGGMISSGSDVNRFLGALLGGELLHPAQLREMMRTRPTGGSDGRRYGLGLESKPLPRGGRYWGHTGDFLGYETAAGATVDGRQATVMVNLGPGSSDAQSDDIQAAVETALSRGRSAVSVGQR
ncbi:serine hydrolase domain-containing protein [Streptomyces anulatus]|uniref:serine hydrolase domain-containing protein n=1 Tax=Streptomyces TaxID=1883 RepID=UPI00093A64B1|nr:MULTISPECIES: serine hydrolase domain-containing protein [unclassified Streptomyces]OKJ15293.1 D-alanyl-D-alanine carboxypeptidase [Streptomyces sp. TSRI0261]QNQ34487.1 beta-lactamase family protein [Streptomyces sp. CB00271]